MLTYYHPFYKYLSVLYPGGEVVQLETLLGTTSAPWKFFARADNLVAVVLPTVTVASGATYVTTVPNFTANFTVRDVTNRSEPFFSASTVARDLVFPSLGGISYAPTASVGPGACVIAAQVTTINQFNDPVTILTCSVFQLNATAGYTWPAASPYPGGSVTYSRYIFNVRLENDAFMQYARDTMLDEDNHSVAPIVTCQVSAVASAGVFYSKNFPVQVVMPVVRDPSFL